MELTFMILLKIA